VHRDLATICSILSELFRKSGANVDLFDKKFKTDGKKKVKWIDMKKNSQVITEDSKQ
jgi:hypothetical protein